MDRLRRCFRYCVVFMLCAADAGSVHAAGLTVFAAASLKESLDEQARRFERATGHAVTVSYGASSALARQIEAGAPADLFLSADEAWMDYVEAKGRLAPGTRRPLLGNALVLIAPVRSSLELHVGPGFALAGALSGGKLAMAQPESVPAGKYGKAALMHLGVWDAVAPQVVPTENVRAALFLVARAEAALGIVYRTDALAEPRVRIVGRFPAASHPAIVYPIAAVKAQGAARAAVFQQFLAAPESRAVWAKYGFTEPAAATASEGRP